MSLPRLDLALAGRTIQESLELVRTGEHLGWGGAWVSELAGIDAVTVAAAIAGVLEHGRVGSAILPMQTRDPLLLAMTAASISQVTKGGFILGLGTSTKVIIENWHATPWGSSPLGLTRECVDLVRRFLAGERITTENGRWRYRRAQLSTRPAADIPIYIAALNDRMLELAGEIADGVLLNFVTIDDLKHARERVAAGAQRAGRSMEGFEFVIYFRATATDDYELVRDRYQSELFTYVMAPVYQQMFDREGCREACLEIQKLWQSGARKEALDAIPPALIRERTLVGTQDEIHARLEAYGNAGLDCAIVFPVAIPDRDYIPECLRNIEALAPPAGP